MGKLLVSLFLVLILSIPSFSYGLTLVTDVDGTNKTMYSQYWEGNDQNIQKLKNSSENSEENWLEALLGLEYDDPSIKLLLKDEDFNQSYLNFTPTFDWDYVVIKAARTSYAFYDTGSNLINGYFCNDVSHITYFTDNLTPVPEPTTFILFGFGILGCGYLFRRSKK